jgi:hypothetical protein
MLPRSNMKFLGIVPKESTTSPKVNILVNFLMFTQLLDCG